MGPWVLVCSFSFLSEIVKIYFNCFGHFYSLSFYKAFFPHPAFTAKREAVAQMKQKLPVCLMFPKIRNWAFISKDLRTE